jgi:hypothetical protein
MSMDVTSLPVERGPGAEAVVPPIDDQLIEVDDHVARPAGVNGIGAIGQVGSAAAIASAVDPATGYRVDDLPVAVGHHLSSIVRASARRGRSTAVCEMTSAASGGPRPAVLLSGGGESRLPDRPLLTTPPRLQHKAFADRQRQRLAAQPWLGIGGLLLAAAVFFALALGTGSTGTSLLILGPLATFALPAVAMVAFWWNDWPGSRLITPWTGLIDTVLVVAASVVLTIAGQAIVERSGVRAVFEANASPGVPTTFPATLALAGAAFTAMLQLSLVCERWPLSGSGRLRSGIAALALVWAAGTGAYFLFVNLDAVPAAERVASGRRKTHEPPLTRGDIDCRPVCARRLSSQDQRLATPRVTGVAATNLLAD